MEPARASPAAQEIRSQIERELYPKLILSRHADSLHHSLEALYAQRDFEPMWTDLRAVAALMHGFSQLKRDGLDPADYVIPDWPAVAKHAAAGNARERAAFDLRISRAYLTALSHVGWGKIDPRSLDQDWKVAAAPVSTRVSSDWLRLAALSGSTASSFALARPPQAIYQRLQQAYLEYLDLAAKGGFPEVPAEPKLEPGMRHPAVQALRMRLAAEGEEPAPVEEPQLYDEPLAEVVRAHQRDLYLEEDGIVGGKTREALNVSAADRALQLRVNLERARWLLADLPKSFVLVDVAGYRLAYFDRNGQVWRSDVVVGKPFRETPTFRSAIDTLVFNPTWTVPPGIFAKDIAPKAAGGNAAAVLEKKNLRAIDAQGRAVPLGSIDWGNPKSVILRQAPGPENPLGQVKFDFPNPYLVYLHDTPTQQLFEEERRANSSGCIRVQNALQLAELLLEQDPQAGRIDIAALLAEGKTKEVKLSRPVPVILHYWTVDVLRDGQIRFKPDIYNRDAPLLEALRA